MISRVPLKIGKRGKDDLNSKYLTLNTWLHGHDRFEYSPCFGAPRKVV